jgi:hypothetical protein
VVYIKEKKTIFKTPTNKLSQSHFYLITNDFVKAYQQKLKFRNIVLINQGRNG